MRCVGTPAVTRCVTGTQRVTAIKLRNNILISICYTVGWVSLSSKARQRNPTFSCVIGLRFLTEFKNLTQPTSHHIDYKLTFLNLMAVTQRVGTSNDIYFSQVSRKVTVLLKTNFSELLSTESTQKYPVRSN